MANIRTLKLNLLADTTDFAKGIGKASGQTDSFSKNIARNMKIATTAAAGFAIAFGVSSVKAALEDEKAQRKLAVALKNTVGATKKQIAQQEQFIANTQKQYGVLDDKLRPAFQRLVSATKDTNKAQDLLNLSLDISTATGKDLESVANSVAKGYNGNFTAIQRLGIGISKATIDSKDFTKVQKEAAKITGGQAAAAAETLEGKITAFKIAMDESKETIGNAIIKGFQPLAEKWLPQVSTGVEHFIDGLLGQDNAGGLNGAFKDNQASVYKLGQDIASFFKTLKDNEELLKRIATVIGAIFIGAKASAAASAMGAAIKTLIPAFRSVTVAAGTTAAAEAAATGGASLAVAAPAILGIATALSLGSLVALYTWKNKPKDYSKDFKSAMEPGSGVSVAKSTAEDLARINNSTGFEGPAGTHKIVGGIDYYWDSVKRKWYSADIAGNRDYSVQPKSITGPSNFRARNSSMGGSPVIINLNGIVDGESARRSIERALQQSSIRTGPLKLDGAAI